MDERSKLNLSSYWTIWAVACLIVNYRVTTGFYSSQVLVLFVFLCWLLRSLFLANKRALWTVCSVVALLLWSVLIRGGSAERFLPDLVKIAVLLVAPIVLRDLEFSSVVDRVTLVLPSFASLLVIFTKLSGAWDDSYDPVLHRFGVPQLGGSPNTAAYVFAFCLLMLHYQFTLVNERKRWMLLFGNFAVLAVAMWSTQSRGGLIIYLAGAVAFARRRWRVPIFVSVVLAIVVCASLSSRESSRMNIVADAENSGGSGRLLIWGELIGDLLDHPRSIIWGNGPGAINFYAFDRYLVVSAHSVVLETIYTYGVIGLAGLGWLVHSTGRAAFSSGVPKLRRQLSISIWSGLFVSMFFDTYPMTAQILWFTPMLISLILRPRQCTTQTSSYDLKLRGAVAGASTMAGAQL